MKNWEAPWYYMNHFEFLKSFLIALAVLSLNMYDIYTDGQLASVYYEGTDYELFFKNDTDPFIEASNCTYLRFENGFYIFKCFKREKTLAIMTLIIMFLPQHF